MDFDTSTTRTALNDYWRWCVLPRLWLNRITIPEHLLPHWQLLPRECLAQGVLSKADCPEHANIWIAPFVAMREDGAYVVPLWLPAVMDNQGHLTPKPNAWPWVPTCLLQPEVTPWAIGEVSACALGLLEAEQKPWTNWGEYWEFGRRLLNRCSDGQWYAKLHAAGFQIQEAGAIVSISEWVSAQPAYADWCQADFGQVLQRACQRLDSPSEHSAAEVSAEHLAYITMSSLPYSSERGDTLRQLNRLSVNDWHVVRVGDTATAAPILTTYLTTQWALAWLAGKPAPKSWLLCADSVRAAALQFAPQSIQDHTLHTWWGIPVGAVFDEVIPKTALFLSHAAHHFGETLTMDTVELRLKEAAEAAYQAVLWCDQHIQAHAKLFVPDPSGGVDAGAMSVNMALEDQAVAEKEMALDAQYQALIDVVSAWSAYAPVQRFLGWRQRFAVLQPGLRDAIWGFYEQTIARTCIAHLLPWDERAFDFGRGLLSQVQHQLSRVQQQRAVLQEHGKAARRQQDANKAEWRAFVAAIPSSLRLQLSLTEDAPPCARASLEKRVDATVRRDWFWLTCHQATYQAIVEERLFEHPYRVVNRHELPIVPPLDIAVFDEAQACTLAECVPVLRQAQRVVVAGDVQQAQQYPATLPVYDEQDVRCFGLDDACIEEWQQSGLLGSARSMMTFAEATDALSYLDEFGMLRLAHSALSTHQRPQSLLNLLSALSPEKNRLAGVSVDAPALLAIGLKGQAHQPQFGQNMQEAHGVARWVQRQCQLGQAVEDIAVYTPYVAQAALLKNLLPQHTILTGIEMPHRLFDTIVCSPVITLECARPLLLESDPTSLIAALWRVGKTFVWIGDVDLCDPQTHGVLGTLGKHMVQMPKDEDAIAVYTNTQGRPLPSFQIQDVAALMQFWAKLLNDARHHLVLVSPVIDATLFEQFTECAAFVAAKGRGVQCTVITQNNQIKSLSKKSTQAVACWSSKYISSGWLAVDEQQLYELPFSLFAPRKYPACGVYWQAYASERIRWLNAHAISHAIRKITDTTVVS
ncbi:MAG: hypothetical protein V4490_03075 [Pseudomonadota bacterium]